MKKIFLLALCGFTLFAVNAQKRSCGSMDVLNRTLQDNPALLNTRAEIENFTQKFITQGGMANTGRSVITIPVVIHVLYNGTSQNISDAQAQTQIDVLNQDYSKTNADVTSVPSVFSSLVANANIQFCLAKRDPNGNATTGIVHKSTNVSSFSTNDAAKYSAQGGDDAWPSASYLNLWCCNLGGGLLGYAQFPGGAAATDGVVINYTAFGNTGTATAPYGLGRTATHEVGHWFNLYHIWGDDNGACTGSDNVSDTPNQGSENYGCPTFPHVSCSNGPNGDMFMNYMDYTDDACMFMFSNGQNARIQALFTTGGARVSLLSSQGCVAPSGGTSCNTPSGLAAGAITATTATLSWTAVSGATSYNVQYKPSTSSTWTTATATTASKSLSGLTASTTYNFQVQAVCSGGSSAYATSSSFTTSAVTTGCTDIYEPNESRTAAKVIAVNTAITGLIGTTTDKDYFKFTNTASQPNIQVTLTNLPNDYDLKLYSSSGSLLATSQNGGTTSEMIKYNSAPVGTYYAYVYGYSRAYSTTNCYTLTASIGSAAWREAAPEATITDKLAEIIYNIYPNPNNGKFTLMISSSDAVAKVSVKVIDMLGNTVTTQDYENVQGIYNAEMNLENVATGIYHVVISDGKTSEVRRIIVQK